ncbi:MFS transporter [Amycolatopsis nigrescens]|uniref:MFS transporter n=1 Tax=Amycolatopsis nigrescens TaxID=381445 RepID=UPI0012FC29C2|nr:MFS transporter [Amycolatopsis nigrescens]
MTSAPEPAGPIGRSRRRLLVVLLAAQFVANIDTAIVNIAAPSIHSGLDADGGQVTLVVSGYIVAYAVLLVTGARLGSTLGHRRVFLAGLLGFTVTSLVCGLAPDVLTLIVARFAQGVGAALMVPQVLSGIQLHFAGRQRVRALGYYALALAGGAVAGQVLGGLLISADLFGTGWRPIFLINVPLGAVLLPAALRFLPRDEPGRSREMDLRGVAALVAAVLLVVLPLVLGREQGWPWWAWLCLGAAGPVFAVFVRTERRVAGRGGRPLVAPELIRLPAVRFGLLAHGLSTMTYFALLFVLALYLQQELGKSPAYSGLAMVVWVAAFGVGGPLLPRVPVAYSRFVPLAGCLVLAAGYASVWVYLLAGGETGPLLFGLLGVGGLGLGLSSGSLISTITSAVPGHYAADLSGVLSTNAQLSGALGVAVAGAVYLGSGSFALVLAGFTMLALAAGAAAHRCARPVPLPLAATTV